MLWSVLVLANKTLVEKPVLRLKGVWSVGRVLPSGGWATLVALHKLLCLNTGLSFHKSFRFDLSKCVHSREKSNKLPFNLFIVSSNTDKKSKKRILDIFRDNSS